MTRDQSCIQFLQWALPRLDLRWPGFRKVRRQVCRRVWRRMQELNLPGVSEYREYLEENEDEWEVLDTFCRIPISRFYRDRGVFDFFREELLPELAREAVGGNRTLCCWSAACAAGEEPYTLALIVAFDLRPVFPELPVDILATDIDEFTLERARRAFFSEGSLKEVPDDWIREAFVKRSDGFFLRPAFRKMVDFVRADIREERPSGPFDLVLCRNLVATYFAEDLQRAVFAAIRGVIRPGGYLVLGSHEELPEGVDGFDLYDGHLGIWRRR